MSNKPLTDKEKQFTILPNETDPKDAFVKAHQAVSKALAQIKKPMAAKYTLGASDGSLLVSPAIRSS